ncbi:hypothetical protein HD554DRAFT_1564446 [Boletus coccyginus]|nr:hypothetical protein HD554DRAFT_1564446 [Boletus coccyginus]
MADHSTQSHYAAAARVPLIKSPAVRIPPPVELPPDIHPLPDSVTPYFAYPFVLEPHILTLESSRRSTLATYVARREGLLRSREDEKEQRRREALRRVAPGFDGNAGTSLEPMRSHGTTASSEKHPPPSGQVSENKGGGSVDVMDNLVDELERMVSTTTTSGRTT